MSPLSNTENIRGLYGTKGPLRRALCSVKKCSNDPLNGVFQINIFIIIIIIFPLLSVKV